MEGVVLIGAEDVRQAGSAMREAAQQMTHAASEMEGAFERQRRFMDDWLSRFEEVVNKMKGNNDGTGKAT